MSSANINRFLQIDCPSHQGTLLIRSLKGHDAISELFSYELELLSEQAVDFSKIAGHNATVTIAPPPGYSNSAKTRYLNGFVADIHSCLREGHYFVYQARMVPWPWFLSINRHCHIMEGVTINEVITQVTQRNNNIGEVKLKLTRNYPTMDYCVQYNESDYAFLCRQLERFGLFFYFTHEKGKHTWTICDDSTALKKDTQLPQLRVLPPNEVSSGDVAITNWVASSRVEPGAVILDDYNYNTPTASMVATSSIEGKTAENNQSVYTHNGNYPWESQSLEGPQEATGQDLAKWQMQAIAAQSQQFSGESYFPGIIPAAVFGTAQSPAYPGTGEQQLVLRTELAAHVPDFETGHPSTGDTYKVSFTCIPESTPYRPPQKTPLACIHGPQSARVVGSSPGDYDTDKYGRIKVQFRWNIHGLSKTPDPNPAKTIYLRVAQAWAGNGHGSLFTPRVGDEVIVSFLNGDPDRPLITGSVYNAENMPPAPMPDNRTQTVIADNAGNKLTMESKADGPYVRIDQPNGNFFLMDQTKGKECIHMMDSYGNELKLDAVEKIARLKSPTHDSYLELGRSAIWGTESDNKSFIMGLSYESVLGGKMSNVGGAYMTHVGGIKEQVVLGMNYGMNLICKMDMIVGWNTKYNWGRENKFVAEDNTDVILGDAVKLCRSDIKVDAKGKQITLGGSWYESRFGLVKKFHAQEKKVAAAKSELTSAMETKTVAERSLTFMKEHAKRAVCNMTDGDQAIKAAQIKIDAATHNLTAAQTKVTAANQSLNGLIKLS